jgi:hypothetical protein
MNEIRLIHSIWKYATIASVGCAIFSPSKVALPGLIVIGVTVSTAVLAPRNRQLEERVKNLEELASK